MIATVPIPPNLLPKLEAMAAECSSLNNGELIFPERGLLTECQEALWCAIDHTRARPHGRIYIDLGKNLLIQATVPK